MPRMITVRGGAFMNPRSVDPRRFPLTVALLALWDLGDRR